VPVTSGAAGHLSRAEVRVSHFHGLKRLVAGLAGVVTVVDPGPARQTVADWAAAGAARYDAPVAPVAPVEPLASGGSDDHNADGRPA